MKRRRTKITRDAQSFREKAEEFLALARVLSKAPKSALRDKLLTDALKTVAVVQKVMKQADDARNWARDVFGISADSHPLMEFASDALSKSVNMTMGFQTYRIKQYLSGKRVAFGPHPAGTLALAALSQIVSGTEH